MGLPSTPRPMVCGPHLEVGVARVGEDDERIARLELSRTWGSNKKLVRPQGKDKLGGEGRHSGGRTWVLVFEAQHLVIRVWPHADLDLWGNCVTICVSIYLR